MTRGRRLYACPRTGGLPWPPLVLLGAIARLRQGEAFGLALDRIDLEAEMITVNQQVVIVERRPVLALPKTSASVRDVPQRLP